MVDTVTTIKNPQHLHENTLNKAIEARNRYQYFEAAELFYEAWSQGSPEAKQLLLEQAKLNPHPALITFGKQITSINPRKIAARDAYYRRYMQSLKTNDKTFREDVDKENDPNKLFLYALCFHLQIGVTNSSPGYAIKLFQRAAEMGCANALQIIALIGEPELLPDLTEDNASQPHICSHTEIFSTLLTRLYIGTKLTDAEESLLFKYLWVVANKDKYKDIEISEAIVAKFNAAKVNAIDIEQLINLIANGIVRIANAKSTELEQLIKDGSCKRFLDFIHNTYGKYFHDNLQLFQTCPLATLKRQDALFRIIGAANNETAILIKWALTTKENLADTIYHDLIMISELEVHSELLQREVEPGVQFRQVFIQDLDAVYAYMIRLNGRIPTPTPGFLSALYEECKKEPSVADNKNDVNRVKVIIIHAILHRHTPVVIVRSIFAAFSMYNHKQRYDVLATLFPFFPLYVRAHIKAILIKQIKDGDLAKLSSKSCYAPYLKAIFGLSYNQQDIYNSAIDSLGSYFRLLSTHNQQICDSPLHVLISYFVDESLKPSYWPLRFVSDRKLDISFVTALLLHLTEYANGQKSHAVTVKSLNKLKQRIRKNSHNFFYRATACIEELLKLFNSPNHLRSLQYQLLHTLKNIQCVPEIENNLYVETGGELDQIKETLLNAKQQSPADEDEKKEQEKPAKPIFRLVKLTANKKAALPAVTVSPVKARRSIP